MQRQPGFDESESIRDVAVNPPEPPCIPPTPYAMLSITKDQGGNLGPPGSTPNQGGSW